MCFFKSTKHGFAVTDVCINGTLLVNLGVFLIWDNDPHVGNSNAAEEQGKSERRHRWEKGRKEKQRMYGKLMFLLLFS